MGKPATNYHPTKNRQSMKAALIFALLFLSIIANAQHTGCFGITDSVLKDNLSTEDRYTIRLFPSAQPLNWYDFSTYRLKGGGKRAVWIAYAAAGILHGGREAYHAEPGVFEKRFNVAPLSFFGSQQWRRQYFNRDPGMPHKPNIWNPVRDYYHFAGAATKGIWIGGAFAIGATEQPVKYRVIDLLIGAAITSVTASATYNLLR